MSDVSLTLIWASADADVSSSENAHDSLGAPLKSIDGLNAWLSQSIDERGDAHLTVTAQLASSALSVSEGRWLCGRLLEQLRGLYPVESVTLKRWGAHNTADVVDPNEVEAAELTLDDHLYAALALDVASRHPAAKLLDLGEERDTLQELACLEAGYRGWVDEDPTIRTSLQIASDVLSFAEGNDEIEAFILDADDLEQAQMNLMLAVGGASQKSPPRLVVATYGDPSPDAAPLMLVGKGITFDSGGINVKPYESFVSMMKNDMGGAALAWHLFKGLVASNFPQPLVVVIPTCENPIGEDAMRPGSLVTGHRGVSVRIDHTDAEGRLILADALSWASERYQPREVITFATLTTAALRSYGPWATPVHFASDDMQAALAEASEQVGEDLHFFPSRVWHREANRDHAADLRNTARLNGHASVGAGSRNAAHFLRFFTDAPLTHLDIFATTWDWAGQSPAGSRHGATGSPLRVLLQGLRAYGDR